MKVALLLSWSYAILATREVLGSPLQPIEAPLDIITLDDITLEDRKEIAYLEERLGRPKRSGKGSAKASGDILGTIVGAIGKGIKQKVGEIALASVAASGQFSKSSASTSSGGHTRGYSYHHEYEVHPHETYEHKPSIDFWSLKKGILNTLLQAVKAIKGGVIAIKGQLIKGSGKLTSVTGNLISVKGDAITDLGKKIITSAVLVNKEHPSAPEHIEYGPPESHYSAPSAHGEIYHASPSAPTHDYQIPHYPSHPDVHAPHKGIQGLLVLKKIPGSNYHHHVEESRTPHFKPIEPTGPSYSSIFGKFFSASTSLDPEKTESFGHTAVAELPHYHGDVKHHEIPPSISAYIDHNHHHIDEEKPTVESESEDFGIPFEKAPEYLNHHFHDYSVSASKNTPQAVKPDSNSSKPTTSKNKQPIGNSVSQNYKFIQKPNSYLPKPSTTKQNIIESPFKSYNTGKSPTAQIYSGVSKPDVGQTFPKVYFQLPTENNHNFQSTNLDSPNSSPSFNQNMQSHNLNVPNPTSNQFIQKLQSPGLNLPKPLSTSGQNVDLNNFQFPIMENNFNYESIINLPNIDDYPEGFPPSSAQIPKDQSANNQLSEYLNVPNLYGNNENFDSFFQQELPSPQASSFQTAISSPSPYLETPRQNVFLPTPMQQNPSAQPLGLSYYSSDHSLQKQQGSGKKSPTVKTSNKPNIPYDLVRSVSYELGPSGPKRLT